MLNAMRVEYLAKNSVFTPIDFVSNRQSPRPLNANDHVFDARLRAKLNSTKQAMEEGVSCDRMTSGFTRRRLPPAW